jgi:2-hydroxy-6-oxonona-2,4-dienedioate hydrolase
MGTTTPRDNDPGGRRAVATWSTEAAGGRWHAQVFADRAPVGRLPIVLVHGLGVASRSLRPTAQALAPHFPAYAPDLPGFGQSSRPRHVLDVPQLARALGAWLDAVGLARPVLLGHSLGCQTVIALAVQQPDRLAAAVLVGPTGEPAIGRLRWAGRLLRDLPRDPLAAVPLVAHDNLRAGPRRVWSTARAMVSDPFLAKLPAVAPPVLVVRGARDPIAPANWAAQVAQTLPAGQLATVTGAAHLVPYSQPDELATLVAAFLAEAHRTPDP